jgi:hypothetical protein
VSIPFLWPRPENEISCLPWGMGLWAWPAAGGLCPLGLARGLLEQATVGVGCIINISAHFPLSTKVAELVWFTGKYTR